MSAHHQTPDSKTRELFKAVYQSLREERGYSHEDAKQLALAVVDPQSEFIPADSEPDTVDEPEKRTCALFDACRRDLVLKGYSEEMARWLALQVVDPEGRYIQI